MKTVVTIKTVAVLDEEFELAAGGLEVESSSVEHELNEWDRFSLEAAVQLRDTSYGDDGEVVVVTVGAAEAEEGLRASLAKGADRAVRVWDESLQDAEVLAVARVLAGVVALESPDLVLCGAQSSDAMHAATGIALAGFLNLPHVAVVKGLEWDSTRGALTVERELEGGVAELLRVPAPAVLTIQTGINEPRYASFRAMKQAREKPLELRNLQSLGLDADELSAVAGSRRTALRPPDAATTAQMLDGTPAVLARRVLDIVSERMGG